MPAEALLFIHPLLGADDAWSGYLVETTPDAPLDKTVLAQLCQHPAMPEFDQRQPWFIPASASEDVQRIANPVHVFTGSQGDSLKTLDELLRNNGSRRCLIATPGKKLPKTGDWNFLQISASHARALPPYTLIGLASQTAIIASEVLNHADHAWCKENACTLATSEFLSARNSNDQHCDLTRIKLLELLGLITEDADTASLEAIFRQEPKLSYSLLRLVNTAAMAPRSTITSFAQAINLLGRRQLQRWLQLLVYADSNNGRQANPLLQKAAARGHLMENLAPSLLPESAGEQLRDSAFMIGAFSLLDALLNMPMREILRQLPLSEMVNKAITEHSGVLGQLLQGIAAAENRDYQAATTTLVKIGISAEAFLDAQISALNWAAKIRTSP